MKYFDITKESQSKVVYIMRGISGSGKSTLANQLGQGGEVFSTDDFFMVNGEYQFDANFLSDAHSWNKGRAIDAMERGVSPIVIDNTHVQPWEAKPYVLAAQKYGYQIEIRESETPWKFDAEELTRRNSHGVPRNVIDDMIDRWHPDMTVDDVLNSEKPRTASTRARFLFAAGLEDSIQNMGLAPDIAQYIMSIPDKSHQGQLFNYVRQNPGATLVELQQWQPPQKNTIDPYIPQDRQIASRLPQKAQQWALVNLKKLRNSSLQLPMQPGDTSGSYPQFEAYNTGYNMLSELIRTNALSDYLDAYPSVQIDGLSIDEVNDDVNEWHEVMAGRGSGKMFGPTQPDNIVYGPNNWSNPEWAGWTIQRVSTSNDLEVEGNQVGHCVGGDKYCNQVENEDIRIFSLRDPSNTPYVTIESDGSEYSFRQIFGNGPKTGNAEPDPVYKKMLGEWMQTLDGAVIDVDEDNPHYEQLSHGHCYPQEVADTIREAVDYSDMSEYGIPNNSTNKELYSVEDLYDVAIKCLEGSHRSYSTSYADDVGEVLGDYALDSDFKMMKEENGNLSESVIKTKAAKQLAYQEFREKFMAPEYDKKYSKGVNWDFSSPEAKAEAEDLVRPFAGEGAYYSGGYHAREKYYEHRASEIIQEAFTNEDLDKKLHSKMVEEFENNSFVGQLMDLRQEKDEEFFNNFDNYGFEYSYPDEDEYENDEDYNDALREYERSMDDATDSARKEDRDSVLFDAAYNEIVKQFSNYDIKIPEWISRYPKNTTVSIEWLKGVADKKAMEETEKRKIAMNWYSQIKEANSVYIGYGDDEKAKARITRMIKGLAGSRGLGQGEQEALINEAVGHISRGHDEQSVINFVNQRLSVK